MSETAGHTDTRANYTLADELRAAEARYTTAYPNGLAQWQHACAALPGGNTRSVLFYSPFPLTMARGEGAYLWDLDGHRYADFLNDFTAGLYGHSHPVIRQAEAELAELAGRNEDAVALLARPADEPSVLQLFEIAADRWSGVPGVLEARSIGFGEDPSRAEVLRIQRRSVARLHRIRLHR